MDIFMYLNFSFPKHEVVKMQMRIKLKSVNGFLKGRISMNETHAEIILYILVFIMKSQSEAELSKRSSLLQ